MLDASSSMTYPWNSSHQRFEVATSILLKVMDSVYRINNEIEFAVRAYGSMYPAQQLNCIDTKLEVPFNLQNTNQIKTRLRNLQPIGSSPIAFSLKKASEEELNEVRLYDYSIIFITDGGENCNGDVCGIYQELLQKKITIKPYIIGLDQNEQLKNYYACIGNYIEVTQPEDIDKAVNLIVEANKAIIQKPRQFNLVTTYSNVTPIKDSAIAIKPPKKDTVVPVPVLTKVDTPKIQRNSLVLAGLNIQKIPKRKEEIISIQLAGNMLARVKLATINLDMEEPKKMSRDMNSLSPQFKLGSIKSNKPGIAVRKLNIRMPKRASLQFEYEEAKKISAGLNDLVRRDYPIKIKSFAPVITVKKSNLKLAKKASLSFEYEEAKKSSPSFELLSPLFADIVLKKSDTKLIAKKSTLKLFKKASLQFEYEEPKKISPAFATLLPYYAKNNLSHTSGKIVSRNSNLKIPKKANLQFEYEEPKKTSPAFASLTPFYADLKLKKSDAMLKSKPSNIKVPKKSSLQFEYEVINKYPLASIKMVKYPRRYSYAFKMPELVKMTLLKRKAVLRFSVEEKKAQPPPLPLGNTVEYTTTVEASPETMIQVYFKGTNGKTYPTAKPQMLLLDAQTNQMVSSFRREMNGSEPVPQKVVAGTYNLVIKGFDDLYANHIEVKPNTTTKVVVKVSDGTLKFTYQGNIKRPVTEYFAVVNRRFAAGATIKQKCTDVLTYEPGTYYIEINTLPPYKASIDLTFDAVYEIQINEPGTLMIMNNKPLGKVQIQYMLGDQFVTFYTMNITGRPEEQKIQLMPFGYKLIYPADPLMPSAGNKELPVKINSNVQTELELK